MRYRLAFDGRTLAAVLRLFIDTVTRSYRARHAPGARDALSGGVTAIQRASSDLRLNPHFHSPLLDGVDLPTADGGLAFHASLALRQEDVAAVLVRARRRILRYLERRGILAPMAAPGDGEVDGCGDDPLADRAPLLARLLSSAVAGAPPAGPHTRLRPEIRPGL